MRGKNVYLQALELQDSLGGTQPDRGQREGAGGGGGEPAWTWDSAFIGVQGGGLGFSHQAHSLLVNLNHKVGELKAQEEKETNSSNGQLSESAKISETKVP